jgi:hypothetical protein
VIVLEMERLQKGFYIIWVIEKQHQYPFKILKI